MRITALTLPTRQTTARDWQSNPADTFEAGGRPEALLTASKLRRLLQEPPTAREVFGEPEVRERPDLTPVACSGESCPAASRPRSSAT